MNGYKYFENGGKNMSFSIKNDEICEKYEDIWDVIKNKPGQKKKCIIHALPCRQLLILL